VTDQGLVQAVRSSTLGSYVALAASIGAGTLVVESALDFNETGGSLLLNGVTYPYISVNYDTDTITLTGTLSVATVLTDRVDVLPLSTEKQALVVTAGSEDAVTVRVPHALMPLLPEGVRTDSEMESVQFEWVNGVFILTDVVGRTPVLDGGYIDDTTVPPSSDGLPPSSVPTPTADGTIGAVLLRWVPIANHDTVTYNLYGSTTLGFTAGPGNLLHSGTEASFTHRPSPPDYAATYYYRLETEDIDGVGPLSAEVSAQLVQATNDDIAAEFGYFGEISVDQLTGGTLNADIALLSTITTRGGGTGAGLDINDTLTRYDSTGTPTAILGDTNTFKGDLEATAATFTGSTAFRGPTEVAKGAQVTLQDASTPPAAAPSAVVGWPDPVVSNLIVGCYGLVWTGTEWASAQDAQSSVDRITIKFTGGGSDIDLTGTTNCHPWGGLTRIGTDWYTLAQRLTGGGVYEWLLLRFNSSGTQQASAFYTPISGSFGSGGSLSGGLGPAAIGTDGTNLLVAEFDDPNNRIRIQTRNPSTLALSSTFNTATNPGFTGPIVGVKKGSLDFGSSQYVVMSRNGTHTWYFDATTGVYNGSAFYNPQPGSMSGFDWDGTRFWSTRAKSVASNAWIYKHTTYTWTGSDPLPHFATSTWRDTDATGGTHQTDMSPVVTFDMKKRAAVTLTSPAIPDSGGTDDPDAVSFFLGKVDTTRTNLWQQTLPAAGVNTIIVGDAITLTGTNPPSSNNFPGGTSATIENPTGTLVVSGDGSIKGSSIAIGATPVLALTQLLSAACSSTIGLTSTEVDITGATLTFSTVRPNAQFMCTGSFYFSANAANTAQAFGKLSVDGTVQTSFAGFTGSNTALDRSNGSQTWIGTLASAGSHTLKLRGVLAGTGVNVNATHTTITVMVFE
jgi:hypothetical protein